MHDIDMFERSDALSIDGFEGSGADWLDPYKKYINDGDTIVASPHKVYGPESNDLSLQLRKRGIDKVLLAGCRRTSAPRPICANFSKTASRWAS